MFPESPTNDFAAKARLIAEGYRKARADAQRPGDIVVNELDQQLRALRATACKKRAGYKVQGTGYKVQGTGYRVQGTGYKVQRYEGTRDRHPPGIIGMINF